MVRPAARAGNSSPPLPWICRFAAPCGLWSCPNVDDLCAISAAMGTLSTRSTRRSSLTCPGPGSVAGDKAQSAALRRHYTLMAWGANGAESKPALSSEGLRIVGLTVTSCTASVGFANRPRAPLHHRPAHGTAHRSSFRLRLVEAQRRIALLQDPVPNQPPVPLVQLTPLLVFGDHQGVRANTPLHSLPAD